MLCIEKRLDWEVEGVKVAMLYGYDCALEGWKYVEVLVGGVVPYGCALLKLYAGSMKNPFVGCLVAGHETGPRVDVGEDAGEDAVDPALLPTSYSARRHASEQ